jgi:hypothetical protein
MPSLQIEDLEPGQTIIIAVIEHEDYEESDDGDEEDIPEDMTTKVLNLVGAKV